MFERYHFLLKKKETNFKFKLTKKLNSKTKAFIRKYFQVLLFFFYKINEIKFLFKNIFFTLV